MISIINGNKYLVNIRLTFSYFKMNHFISKEIDIKLLCIGGFLGCPLRSVFSGVVTRTAKKSQAAIFFYTFVLAKHFSELNIPIFKVSV